MITENTSKSIDETDLSGTASDQAKVEKESDTASDQAESGKKSDTASDQAESGKTKDAALDQSGAPAAENDISTNIDILCGFEQTGTMPLEHAREFRVDYYSEAYALITIHDQFQYLLLEEGAQVPENLPQNIQILQKPLDHIYAASSSCPDFFRELGTIGQVTMTSTKAEDWTIPEIKKIVSDEDMIYVGKYSAPDYEYICDEGCSLAIENTMIYHAPDVSEMLRRLGIPVLTEYSSYEKEPLGRLEWIMLYGLLTDREQEARAFFEEQVAQMQEVLERSAEKPLQTDADKGSGPSEKLLQTDADKGSGPSEKPLQTDADKGSGPSEKPLQTEAAGKGPESKTNVVFFYIGTDGGVNVRREDDYVSRMIAMAGGSYMLRELEEELPDSDSGSGSITVQMESFYAAAKDADVLIYNGTLGESLEDMDALLEKSPLLEQFAAVKTGRVYCSQESLFQEVTGTCRMVADFSRVIRETDGESDENLTYLRKLT